MKNFIAFALLGLSFSAFASTQICTYEFSQDGSVLSWTAFKTPKKVGVKGQFSKFKVTAIKAANINELLSAASFDVDSQSVVTGDKARDAKIMQFFFKKMIKGTHITGKVLKVTGGMAEVELTLNGTTKTIIMLNKFDEALGKLTLTSAIDVLEFGMKDNLATLTKACFEKHEGVTWPNVDMELVATIKKSCK